MKPKKPKKSTRRSPVAPPTQRVESSKKTLIEKTLKRAIKETLDYDITDLV